MRLRFLKLCCLVLFAGLPLKSLGQFSDASYDQYFIDSTERYLAKHYCGDWYLLKAQAIAESALDPRARSPVGAMGIMQIMPATWAEISRQIGLNASPYNPRASIIAGAFYQNRMLSAFTVPRSPDELRAWAWSAYNAGLGTVLKAQKRAGGSAEYYRIRPYLPGETVIYVARIRQYHHRLLYP